MGSSAPIQDAPVQRCSITLEHVELSGHRWIETTEVHAAPEDVAELLAWLTRQRARGSFQGYTITVRPAA